MTAAMIEPKAVAATQKAVDAIPLDSGTWRVVGVPGLYLRAHRTVRSFFVQRRVKGRLIKATLGPLPMKLAKQQAMKLYGDLKPKPAVGDVLTLSPAFQGYLTDRKLSTATIETYTGNFERHLEKKWGGLALADIAKNRPGVRQLYRDIKKGSGLATARGVIKLLSAIFEWARGEDLTLPESPTSAVRLDKLEARDWALDDEGLRQWWAEVQQETVIVRMFYTVALLTGARRGSVESLEWKDVDLDAATIHFRIAKGGRAYSVPMSDLLKTQLIEYHKDAPDQRWVFPSSKKRGQHVAQVAGRAHHLRHQFKTVAAQLGIPELIADLLQGHALGGVSRGYVTAGLLTEPLRAATNAISGHYAQVLSI